MDHLYHVSYGPHYFCMYDEDLKPARYQKEVPYHFHREATQRGWYFSGNYDPHVYQTLEPFLRAQGIDVDSLTDEERGWAVEYIGGKVMPTGELVYLKRYTNRFKNYKEGIENEYGVSTLHEDDIDNIDWQYIHLIEAKYFFPVHVLGDSEQLILMKIKQLHISRAKDMIDLFRTVPRSTGTEMRLEETTQVFNDHVKELEDDYPELEIKYYNIAGQHSDYIKHREYNP